jgi:xanthosine phosphorylase
MHKQDVEASRDIIRAKIGTRQPKIAIILGSGLGGLTGKMSNTITIPYKDLPGFPALTVEGHTGEVVAGLLGSVEVLAFRGRKHFYETDDAYPLKTMIRTVKALDIEILFLSNAAGSLRDSMLPGSLMRITDHINYMGINPLTAHNDDAFGPRFPSMTDAWDPILSGKLADVAEQEHIPLHEGVYIGFRGPSFETPAEIRMAQTMGAAAVGMSSVPDCIIARHCGLRVIGCSCITNMGAGLSDEVLSHALTMENAAHGAINFEKLVTAFVKHL